MVYSHRGRDHVRFVFVSQRRLKSFLLLFFSRRSGRMVGRMDGRIRGTAEEWSPLIHGAWAVFALEFVSS